MLNSRKVVAMDIIKHAEVFNPSKVVGTVAVVGVGALGSALALQLAKLGLTNIILFDDDKVEPHNLPNQILYGPADVGEYKTFAAIGMIERLTGYRPYVGIGNNWNVPDKLTTKSQLRNAGVTHVFIAVDSMAARKAIFNGCVYMNPDIAYYNEGRMGSRAGSLYAFDPKELAKSKAYRTDALYDDDQVTIDKAACGTILSIGATANMLACAMIWHFIESSMGRQPKYEELAFSTSDLSVHHKGNL